MTNLSKHPLLQQAYDVIQAIEECGASPKLTDAVIKASALLDAIDRFLGVPAPVVSVRPQENAEAK